jgi:hypothetical protein
MARNAATAVKAEARASPMPKLHKANTVACGLLNAGRGVLIIAVHSRIRLGLDSVARRGLLGCMDTLSMTHGGWSGHGPSIQFPKTLPQKAFPWGASVHSGAGFITLQMLRLHQHHAPSMRAGLGRGHEDLVRGQVQRPTATRTDHTGLAARSRPRAWGAVRLRGLRGGHAGAASVASRAFRRCTSAHSAVMRASFSGSDKRSRAGSLSMAI